MSVDVEVDVVGLGFSSKSPTSYLSSFYSIGWALIAKGLLHCLKNLRIFDVNVTGFSSLPFLRCSSKVVFPFPLGWDLTT